MKRTKLRCVLVLVAAGCVGESSQKERVTEHNDLGIATLELDRPDSDTGFELRGLDGNGDEVARFRLHTGAVEELARDGTEITISVRDESTRMVTSETKRWSLPVIGPSTTGVAGSASLAAR